MTHKDISKTYFSVAELLPAYIPLFLFEIEKMDYLVKMPDKETSVISLAGHSVKKIWVTGTLTSYESGRQGDIIRIADPTGAVSFLLKPHTLDNLEQNDLTPPLFIGITASPEKNFGSNNNSGIRWVIETCKISTKEDRDAWIIAAADFLLENLQKMKSSFNSKNVEPIIRDAQKHYHIQDEQLKFYAELAEKALNVIKEPGPPVDPGELILSIIKNHSGPRGIHLEEIYKYSRREALPDDLVKDTIRILVSEDEIYQPAPGYVKLL